LKSSFKYFVAKCEYRRNQEAIANGEVVKPEDLDYIPTKKDLTILKAKMDFSATQMKAEREDNMDLIPEDVNGNNIEVVKEQILDLNDKFDFLISLLVKGQKLGVHSADNGSDSILTDFSLSEGNSTSLNRDSAAE